MLVNWNSLVIGPALLLILLVAVCASAFFLWRIHLSPNQIETYPIMSLSIVLSQFIAILMLGVQDVTGDLPGTCIVSNTLTVVALATAGVSVVFRTLAYC